jgi:peptide deformylase
MAMLEVLRFPDPRLRKMSEPVEAVSEELKVFAADMLETMRSERGIGLAAPQVNRLIRLIIVDTRPQEKDGRYKVEGMTELEQEIEQPLTLFNPVITKKEGETTYDEGCLSVPGYFETVKRFNYIEVEALNLEGEKIQIKVDGLTSICIQHEIDHLDGKLFIDRLSLLKGNKIKNKIKKYGYPSKDDEQQEELS